jgi:hypothetical protein
LVFKGKSKKIYRIFLEGQAMMTLKSPRGLRNRLLRRVRRHAAITTMFRPADPSFSYETANWGQNASMPAGTPADYQRDGNLVQASIISEPIQPAESFQLDTLLVPTRDPGDFTSPIQSSREPVDTPSSNTQEQNRANTEIPSNLNDDEAFDDGWQQLKTIYRLHQEKRLKPKGSPDSAINIQSQGEQREKTGSPDQQPQIEPTGTSGSDEALLNVNLETHGEVKPQSMADPTMEHQELEAKTVSFSRPGIDDNESTTEESQPISETRKTSGENLLVDTLSETHDNEIGNRDLESGPPTNLDLEPSFSEQEENMVPANPVQPVPLEAAWPVQRQPVKSDEKIPTAGTDTKQTIPSPHSPVQTDSNDTQQTGIDIIQNTLSQVIPNQPTKSSIELIPPRQPRPDIQRLLEELREETPSEVAKESSDLPLEEERKTLRVSATGKDSPQASQNQRDEKTIIEAHPIDKGTPLGLYPAQKEVDKSLGDSITESRIHKVEERDSIQQHQPQIEPTKSKESGHKNDSKLIQTGIGPLPADLWDILDKDPPITNNFEADSPESRIGSPARIVDVPRKSNADIDNYPKPLETSIPEPSSSIQRADTGDEVQTPTSTTSASEHTGDTSPEEESSQIAEPDIGELSRRVYSEIRHQLMVEWERSRIRK